MASTSRSEADVMIEEFIRLQEAQARLQEAQVRLQEVQVTLLKRMVGSSPAAGTSTTTKDAEGNLEKESLLATGDSMRSGQYKMAVQWRPWLKQGEIVEEESEAGEISEEESEEGEIIEEESEAKKFKDRLEGILPKRKMGQLEHLEGMHLREVSDQDPPSWERALHWDHCKSLMTQLKKDPSLMMLTLNGRTVLHVASIHGCTPLVHQVLQKCKWNLDDKKAYGDLIPTGVDAVYFAVDVRTQLSACDINRFFVGQKYSTPSPVDGINDYHNGQLVEQIRADINQFLLYGTDISNDFLFDRTGVSNVFQIYGFGPEHIELTFHYACGKLRLNKQLYMDYIEKIIECVTERHGVKTLNCLLKLQDRRGNPPFQVSEIRRNGEVLENVDFMTSTFAHLLQSKPDSYGIFINAPDARGWTFLHKCAARGYHEAVEMLMKEESIDGNLTLPKSRATPLHLAILHNHPQVVKSLLMAKDKINVNAIFERSIVYGEKDKSGNERSKDQWTPLQLAAIMGSVDVVRELLVKVEQIHDVGKRVKNVVHDDNVSALHMAAASGIPEVLRLFLNDGAFNPLELTRNDKRSALHFATDTTTPCTHAKEKEDIDSWTERRTFTYPNPFLKIIDFASLDHHTRDKKDCENDTMDPKSHWRTKEEYGGKMACITMLLQVGIDVWQQDGEKNYAEPGSKASTDVRLWWYEKVAQETLEAKKNLNDAGNAISVVAALVATASYVGPLQPPLGFASDPMDPTSFGLVQATNLMIQVFVVFNCLSFYLAIGSIMFAVVPSLPMPQEGILEEWQRSRRSVAFAMSFLLLSILGVLVSFAAALNVGMSKYYSWQHVGLAFYPTLFGGIACLLGIIVFFIRLLRLILHKNERIRYVYQMLS